MHYITTGEQKMTEKEEDKAKLHEHFSEWFNGHHSFYTLRSEWFFGDLDLSDENVRKNAMLAWLQAAYAAGWENSLSQFTSSQ